jgi:4'-phosphopantetheinyl transferase
MAASRNLDALLGWLSDEERRRGERFRHAGDARAFLFRRAFRRSVLARYAGVAPGELAFETGEHGKPFLSAPHGGVRFNASSSGAWVLVAVSAGRELGVDVERADERFLGAEELSRLAQRVLTPAERDGLARLPDSERPNAFLRAWTRKEALLKALGTGLSREPDTVEVGLEPWAGSRRLEGAFAVDLEAPSGFAANLVLGSAGNAGLQPGSVPRFSHRLLPEREERAGLEPGVPG